MSDMSVIPEPRATELIDEIMDNFAFDEVAKMMKAVQWEWCDCGVPDERMLRIKARKLLREVVSSKTGYVSTGGFTAHREDGLLELSWGVEWRAGGVE